MPLKIDWQPNSSTLAETLAQCRIHAESAQALRQRANIAARNEDAVGVVLDDVRDDASTIGDVRNAGGPGFEQDQAKGIRSARQRKQVDCREEVALLRIGSFP